ncbi:hypothetical protein QWZ13_06175 [Reinekea marina]|uniref:hypothetical protein n=1 Tax=Reinekea marina TaxID=1310421 RepID=UPI0025B407AB|nr:hypothetical protein [Reinekea marina]MDN3648494.1 hypothetical protein [Reinekea marina]
MAIFFGYLDWFLAAGCENRLPARTKHLGTSSIPTWGGLMIRFGGVFHWSGRRKPRWRSLVVHGCARSDLRKWAPPPKRDIATMFGIGYKLGFKLPSY